MEIGKIILAFGITMALSICTLTMMLNTTQDQSRTKPFMKPSITTTTTTTTTNHVHRREDDDRETMIKPPTLLRPSKRLSRFLADGEVNPRATEQCRGKNKVCNNKCVDLMYDDDNCGRCNNTCNFTQKCCRGSCVYLSLDKRHCGECNHRCNAGDQCIYGLCNYS